MRSVHRGPAVAINLRRALLPTAHARGLLAGLASRTVRCDISVTAWGPETARGIKPGASPFAEERKQPCPVGGGHHIHPRSCQTQMWPGPHPIAAWAQGAGPGTYS